MSVIHTRQSGHCGNFVGSSVQHAAMAIPLATRILGIYPFSELHSRGWVLENMSEPFARLPGRDPVRTAYFSWGYAGFTFDVDETGQMSEFATFVRDDDITPRGRYSAGRRQSDRQLTEGQSGGVVRDTWRRRLPSPTQFLSDRVRPTVWSVRNCHVVVTSHAPVTPDDSRLPPGIPRFPRLVPPQCAFDLDC